MRMNVLLVNVMMVCECILGCVRDGVCIMVCVCDGVCVMMCVCDGVCVTVCDSMCVCWCVYMCIWCARHGVCVYEINITNVYRPT